MITWSGWAWLGDHVGWVWLGDHVIWVGVARWSYKVEFYDHVMSEFLHRPRGNQ